MATTGAFDQNSVPQSEELSLLELGRILWSGRGLILLITLTCLALGVSYALLAQSWYRAEVVLLPAASGSTSSGLGQLGGLVGLASVVGVDLKSGGNTAESLAVLRSRDFSKSFIEKEQLLPVLFSKMWDVEKQAWRSVTGRKQPDIRDGVDFFVRKVRTVTEDKKSGLTTLAISWTDPELCAQWANMMVEEVNARLRTRAIQDAERNIKYLQGEMAATNIASMQQSLGKVLESEMQKLLLARGDSDFAFKVIDRAVVPKKRYKPKRSLIAAGSFLGGLLFSGMLVLVRAARPGKRN